MTTTRRTFLLALIVLVVVSSAAVVYRQFFPETRDGVYLTRSKDPRILNAYTVAREKRALMAQLTCHCGCSQHSQPHANVLDCFATAHAETCTICIQTVDYAAKAAAEGRTVPEIQRYLRNVFQFDYSSGGDQGHQ